MPPAENQRLTFRDKFRSLHYEAFQAWIEELLHALHPVGDFQAIRKTQGDGGLDGFVISSQLVYAVYAPARRNEDRDSETAAKIRSDFAKASSTLGGQLKAWIFVHNHPEGKLGKLSARAVSELKSRNPSVEIAVLNIDSLWGKLTALPDETLRAFFGENVGLAAVVNPPEAKIPNIIKRLLDKAEKFSAEDRFADAVPILEKALKAAIRAKHDAAQIKIYTRLGHALFETAENFVGAEEHFRKALELAGESPSSARHSALHGLGDVLLWAGRLEEAEAVIQASLEVAKSLGKQDAIGRSLISVALLQRDLGHSESAVSHLDDAIRIFHRLALSLKDDAGKANAHALAVSYQNKAQFESDDGRLENALVFYGKVEALHKDSGDRLNSGKVQLLVGKLHCANADAELGFQSFKRAMAVFLELKNPLWIARVSECVARLYAQHERWEEALKPALAAVEGFREAGRFDEQTNVLLVAAKLAARWQEWALGESVKEQIHEISKNVPKDREAEIMASLTAQMTRVQEEIAEKVRSHPEIRALLDEAKALAEKEHLQKELADCFLAEMHLLVREEDKDTRQQLIESAIASLRKALENNSVPRRRGHLMGEISALYRRLGKNSEAAFWLRRAGELFEKTGDIFGLANFHGSMAEVHREAGNFEAEIAAYRRVLELIEGRSFHQLAAGTRIDLAAALRLSRDFEEAQALLTEAEAICKRHRMKDFISAIARNRSDIETELNTGQAASHTLAQLLCSLHQLLRYKPEHAIACLAFWYFAWKTELMSLLRSGPGISFMVVTDDVERFVVIAAKFSNLADHFLLATTKEPTLAAETRVVAIPPTWRFPPNFQFLFVKKPKRSSGESGGEQQTDPSDGPPNIELSGPATMLPLYIPVSVHSAAKGEGHFSALATPHLPKEAIDLMTRRPIKELIEKHAVWFPSPRFDSKDAFLTDLRVAHERDLFPVYCDCLPTSDGVTAIGAVAIAIPASVLTTDGYKLADKWKRALLKITRLRKDEARVALLELPDAFSNDTDSETGVGFEVHLFEFTEIGRKVIHPAILIRGTMVRSKPKT
jgi:tetratricopeptide (TPR) repeat protein